MWSRSSFTPSVFSTSSRASLSTVRVLSPRKSIFNSPSSSMVFIGNWVTRVSSFLDNGTYSTRGLPEITTPAAWVEECLGIPSKDLEISIRYFTLSSSSYCLLSSGFISIALSMVMLSSIGIILAITSTSA